METSKHKNINRTFLCYYATVLTCHRYMGRSIKLTRSKKEVHMGVHGWVQAGATVWRMEEALCGTNVKETAVGKT